MYGNNTLPGITPGATIRNNGSIWRGYTEATWFKTVAVSGDSAEAVKVPKGTILIEDMTDGTYAPMTADDIITTVDALPGARLVIVADSTGTSETTTTADDDTVKTTSTVLVGIMGQVDQGQLLVGDTKIAELNETQQIGLRTQLEA